MKVFWLRLGLFLAIWLLLITMESSFVPYHILICTVALLLFFLLTFQHRVMLLYVLLLLVVFIGAIQFVNEILFSVVLLWFLLWDSLHRISIRMYYGLTAILLAEILMIMWIQQSYQIELLISTIVIVISGYFVLKEIYQRKYYRKIYHELLNEYRKLKRMNITAENNARLEERTKIARDMHDTVGHRLTALIMRLELLSIEHSSISFDTLKELAKESLEDTRQAVKTLQLDESEGIASVVHLIRKLEAESHITVQFTMKKGVLNVPLSNDKSVILYRIIQEAITNAMRHANSREVNVILSKSADGALTFEITNAIFESKQFELGFGLKNMKVRVAEVNGTLNVYQLENRFIVSGRIPVQKPY
ncbi:histidine kinase [Oceanobacillus kimchii]|uniref:histidine kinase n=1 Tax=Oceanobacillus kimchii TaxID=746691 RepID=A0ABQ5TIK4_9BACI|nr:MULTISPECIES: histidine kinase [Oceanobacillus]MCT1578578.1 histidine kinase [Oceanobacillus kimchii]MCT2136373.1 histidine kinase [Oceanobacillus kimchii]OEH54217.1 histidine kinase [Oceanobacillus sp. E9]GLO65519.1 two-component sensor histidine kinase [Oceanobacillus kimchii]